MKWQAAVKVELDLLKELEILVPSTSAWGSPIVPVAKGHGGVRVCVDFRRVNKLTVKDSYHIPLVAEIVERVGKVQVLSKLDLSKGFYQVKLADEVRAKTAIVTQFGKLEFTRMPFGLVNATSTFQRLMDLVLEGLTDFCSAYVDDILIHSKDWASHLEHLDIVWSGASASGGRRSWCI